MTIHIVHAPPVCCRCENPADPLTLLEEENTDGTVDVYCYECALIKLGYGRLGIR